MFIRAGQEWGGSAIPPRPLFLGQEEHFVSGTERRSGRSLLDFRESTITRRMSTAIWTTPWVSPWQVRGCVHYGKRRGAGGKEGWGLREKGIGVGTPFVRSLTPSGRKKKSSAGSSGREYSLFSSCSLGLWGVCKQCPLFTFSLRIPLFFIVTRHKFRAYLLSTELFFDILLVHNNNVTKFSLITMSP